MQVMCTNKKLSILSSVLFLLLFCENSSGQALKKGDSLRLVSLGQIYNYKSEVLDLESLKGKAIIFDFWAPNCKSCLGSFIKLDSLQQKFGDKIQFVLVNKQSRDSTARFFAMRPFLHRPNLPFVTNDTLLHRLFPRVSVPAIVWIDKNKVFHKMTSEIGAGDVIDFLEKNLVKPNAYVRRITHLNTLFNVNFEDSITYHSYFSKKIHGIGLTTEINRRNGIVFTNKPLWMLYLKAFEENDKYNLKGPQQIIFPLSEIENKNLDIYYNYSLQLPLVKKAELYQTMQEDLKRNFGYEVKVEMRKAKTLVMVSKDNKNKMATKGGEKMYSFKLNDQLSINRTAKRVLNNYPMDRFIENIKGWVIHKLKMPFVNEVTYRGNVDVIFDGEIVDNLTIAGLRSELNRYGLDLIEKEIEQWTLVFR